jgi:cytosine/adenosine deaminase-related metal-dependent hydrolase
MPSGCRHTCVKRLVIEIGRLTGTRISNHMRRCIYNASGLLHSRSILAHCIHLSETDMRLLEETKAGVAHNPNSNTCLRDGECRVRELLNRGIKVGLGTDWGRIVPPDICRV